MGPANVVGLLSLPPPQYGSCQCSRPSLFTTLLCPSALHLTRQTVGSHRWGSHLRSLYVLSPPLLYFCLSFRYLLPQHLHQKADRIDTKLAVPSECSLCHLLYLSIYDSVWRLPVCLLFQFMGYHFLGWTGSPSYFNSIVCHSTFAHSY